MGLNSRTSLDQAALLGHLGLRLQGLYRDLVEEPLPDHLATLVDKLNEPRDVPPQPPNGNKG